jgi:hypothetical protein
MKLLAPAFVVVYFTVASKSHSKSPIQNLLKRLNLNYDVMKMSELSVSKLAYVLALIGGVVLVIFGLLSFVGDAIESFGPVFHWHFFPYFGIVAIICGIIAIIGAKSVTTLVWSIVLIIVGIIGGGLGGLLIVLGGIIGFLIYITKKV